MNYTGCPQKGGNKDCPALLCVLESLKPVHVQMNFKSGHRYNFFFIENNFLIMKMIHDLTKNGWSKWLFVHRKKYNFSIILSKFLKNSQILTWKSVIFFKVKVSFKYEEKLYRQSSLNLIHNVREDVCIVRLFWDTLYM